MLKARVRYHIQSERQHQMLINKYVLTEKDPYWFTVYERDVPLTGNLTAGLDPGPDPRVSCMAPQHTGKQGLGG
ncbi:hypothetical protein [Nitrospira sp. Nam74]